VGFYVTFCFHKIQGFSSLAENRLAIQEVNTIFSDRQPLQGVHTLKRLSALEHFIEFCLHKIFMSYSQDVLCSVQLVSQLVR
jgi:hypothetical protein